MGDRLCRMCRKSAATGIIFELCDPCMDLFEADVERRRLATGDLVALTDDEIEFLNEPFVDRRKN